MALGLGPEKILRICLGGLEERYFRRGIGMIESIEEVEKEFISGRKNALC